MAPPVETANRIFFSFDWRLARKGQSDERERKEEEEEEKGGSSIFHATFSDCSHRVERGLLNRLLRVFVGPVDIIIERESGDEIGWN